MPMKAAYTGAARPRAAVMRVSGGACIEADRSEIAEVI
jgi:hypothetical protein